MHAVVGVERRKRERAYDAQAWRCIDCPAGHAAELERGRFALKEEDEFG